MEGRTSNNQHPTTNIQRPTSNVERPIMQVRAQAGAWARGNATPPPMLTHHNRRHGKDQAQTMFIRTVSQVKSEASMQTLGRARSCASKVFAIFVWKAVFLIRPR